MHDTKHAYDTIAAAGYVGVKPSTLAAWRSTRVVEIPYVKVGRRVVYLQQDLDEFLESRSVKPCTQAN